MSAPRAETTTILDGARLLARHGGVVEVRIPNAPRQGTVSGYFDDLDALALAVESFDGKANIYMTANPVLPELLARAVNRLQPHAKVTTGDAQILRRAWFLTDVDPARPRGISATDAEVRLALARRDDVVAFLRELDFPEPGRAMSGNGGHAIWAVDEPNDEATTALVERALKALGARFTDAAVAVDESVFNAARIWKLYGTRAVKGDATADRPHRRAVLESVPDELVLLDRAVLERLAAMAPTGASRPRPAGSARRPGGLSPIDLIGAFEARGDYRRALSPGKHAVTCPWQALHSGASGASETVVFAPAAPGEPWGFKCQHAHCSERTIVDVLRAFRLGGEGRNGQAGTLSEEEIAALDAAPAPEPATPALPYTFTSPFPPGHFVADWIAFASTCTDAAHEYHEAAALICLAAATPRVKARGGPWPHGLRTNLYVLLVGDSSTSRKSTSADLATYAIECATPEALGPNRATPEAFVEQVAKRNGTSIVIAIDEFTGMVDSLHHQKYMTGLRELLCVVYDGRSHRYSRHSKRVGKDGQRQTDEDDITDPYISLLGCSTEEIFDVLTRKDVRSGFVPRFAVEMPATKPRRRGLHELSMPDDAARGALVGHLRRISAWAHDGGRAVTFDPGTLECLDAFAEETERISGGLDSGATAMLVRTSVMAFKVAMLAAVGRPESLADATLRVALPDAEAGVHVATRWRATAIAFAARIGETDLERHLHRALRVLAAKGGATTRRVVAQGVHVDKKTLDAVEATLVDRGLIAVRKVAVKGRPTMTLWESRP